MTTRFALFDLIARTNMDREQALRLWRLAGLDGMPERVLAYIRLGMTVAGAGCAGLGLIFWVAANWEGLSRFQHFALLQALVLAPCAALASHARNRAALGLLAVIAVGALFAYFGQTYQTGSDPCQLFAVWAVLALPLACCARVDTVWTAWALIALIALALCGGAYIGYSSYYEPADVRLAMATSGSAAGLTLALRTVGRRYLGAGDWTFRLALVLTVAWVTTNAISELKGSITFHSYYWFSVILAGSAGTILVCIKPFDAFPSSVVALCLNILLMAGLTRALLKPPFEGWIVSLLFLGVVGAALLAGSAKLIVTLGRTAALQTRQEDMT